MVTDNAILYGKHADMLSFSEVEHPVAVQLGGSNPKQLAAATKIASGYGYNEINLNVGCPSERVQNGCFGAALIIYYIFFSSRVITLLFRKRSPGNFLLTKFFGIAFSVCK